jgi:hypothetical protein
MLQDLDPKLIDALEELRREFDDKLSRQQQAIERLVGSSAEVVETEPAATAAEPEPVAAAAHPASALDPLEELKLASADIDRSESQGDVLDALIRGASRFSSRSALFLCRDGAFHGWGGTGFGESDSAIKDMTLDPPAGSAWEEITADEGGICLTSGDCSVLLEKLGSKQAEIGVLIPFVLRRQVAAVLYSDRLDQDPLFNISGLQLLSFLAGQTVETLPIRERSSTSSLQLAVAPATKETSQPVVVPEPEEEEPEIEAEAVEATPEPVVEAAPEPEESQPEPEQATPDWSEPSITSPIEPAPEEVTIDETATEDLPIIETADDLLPEPEPEPEALDQQAPEADTLPELDSPDASDSLDTSAFDAPVEPPALDVEPEPEPQIPEAPAPEVELTEPEATAEATPDPDGDGVDLGPAAAPSPTSTQVQPPQDVEGPGWAFTTTRIPTSAGAEALHEEARRLARLLVTEIKLYNEELVEEGRQSGDVYSRLREDIDRSRQIFDDRIDPEVRSEKDYFREALVRILAGGDPDVLGISN